jgi:hypothetical protein
LRSDACILLAIGLARDAQLDMKGDIAMSAFNWSTIDWISLVALSVLVLVAANVGERLSFGNRGVGALLAALFFAVGFAAWSYSLHDAVTHAIAMLRPGMQG